VSNLHTLEALMDQPFLRLLIQEKLADGRLPHTPIQRVWSGPGNEETCDGCGEAVTNAQTVMENLNTTGGGVQFHAECFHVWDIERHLHAREQSARLPSRSGLRAPGARSVRSWAPIAPPARPASSASP
jgi:hypothetical protein